MKIQKMFRRFVPIVLLLAIFSCSSKSKTPEVVSNQDYTSELKLSPGLVINKMVFGGVNTNGKLIGDYETIEKIVSVDDGGFSFHWATCYPASMSGSRAVDASDMQNSHRYSLFLMNHEKGLKAGFTALLISQDVFKALKAGGQTPYTDDSPMKKPTTVGKIGEETLPLWVNDREVTVKTLKAQADNGDVYWFLDNAQWPLLVKKTSLAANSFITSLTYPELLTKQFIDELKSKKELATYSVYFSFRSSVLQGESSALLDELGKYLKENSDAKLAVEVHSDNIGDSNENLDLTQKRAESVKNYLAGQGVSADRVTAKGLGDTQAIADNSTNTGRAKNRRVVFKLN